jgi:hypothetical protein
MVDKLCWPAEKKARIKDLLHRLIDIAQFEWNRKCGPFGYCNEWVDEIYPKIKDMLPDATKEGITVSHIGWKTNPIITGHEAVRIHVQDDPRCKSNNGFTFYLDDRWVGGLDHVFVDAEINPKWKVKFNHIMAGGNETLEDLILKPPIGPGPRPRKPLVGSGY